MLEVGDLLVGEPAGLDQFVQERVIAGRRVQLAAPPEIAAAVAHPAEPGLFLAHQAGDVRGAHAALARVHRVGAR